MKKVQGTYVNKETDYPREEFLKMKELIFIHT